MNVYRYTTSGGKDVVDEYIKGLPVKEQYEFQRIINLLETHGLDAFPYIDTKPFIGKVREIRFCYQQRVFYVLIDGDNIILLHACKKQKGKAEEVDKHKAIDRAKKIGKELGKRFV